MPFQLPQNFDINLPDINQFAESAVGFEPNPDLPRVSDVQREQDALAYREQMNAASNLKDSIGVASKYLDAAISATKLGKGLVTYQIGLQDIRTEKVNYQKSTVRTEIASTELQELLLKLDFQTNLIPQLERGFQGALMEAQTKADMAHRRAEKAKVELETRFPVIDIQARLAA